MDKISELPDDLLVKILLLIPTKVAISTSLLSKRWEHLWMWLPKLKYGCNHRSDSAEWKRLQCFLNKKLPLHRAPVIESFSFDLDRCCSCIIPDHIKMWLAVPLSHCLRELEIVYGYGRNMPNILTRKLFTCKSLEILKLEGDSFLLDVPRMVFLPSLKTLKLQSVRYFNQESLERLLSKCPILEDLSLSLCEKDNTRTLSVVVPSLQSLSLCIPNNRHIEGIVIVTPSLKNLELKDHSDMNHYYLTENMPNLIKAYVDATLGNIKSLIESITSVKHLTIFKGVVFNQLEHLELCRCKKDFSNLLVKLLKDSSNLQLLDLFVMKYHYLKNVKFHWNQPSVVPECILSSLRTLKLSDYKGKYGLRDIVVYILQNAVHLKTARIKVSEGDDVPKSEIIKELVAASRASTTCQLMFD